MNLKDDISIYTWLFLIFLFIFSLYLLFLFFNMMWASLTGPPIVYASRGAVNDAIAMGNLDKDKTFVDLGCGNGQTLIVAAKKYNAKK